MGKLSQATVEQLGHYVYLLIDPRDGKAFYVGKGHANRVYRHRIVAVRRGAKKTPKNLLIKEIEAQGLEVKLVVLRHGLTGPGAFEVECAVIDLIGMENLTNEVNGHYSAERGKMSLDDLKVKYDAKPANITEPALLINIHKKYYADMPEHEMLEATRKSWKLSAKRVAKVEVVCAVYKGIIRGVYIPAEWLIDDKRRPRLYFEGRIAPKQLQDKYIRHSVEQYIKKHNQNPIKYVGIK